MSEDFLSLYKKILKTKDEIQVLKLIQRGLSNEDLLEKLVKEINLND